MRRRTGRPLPDLCPTAPNRSGDGAPAPVHGSLGHAPDMERPVKRALHLLVLVLLERSRRRSRRPCRRLITLIFADRAGLAVMVVIRRELPRTRVAGPATGLSRRSAEDPPSRVPPDRRPHCSSILIRVLPVVRAALGARGRATCGVLLDVHTDRPDKAEELAADRGHDLRGGFPLGDQSRVASVQPVLCLPGERFEGTAPAA